MLQLLQYISLFSAFIFYKGQPSPVDAATPPVIQIEKTESGDSTVIPFTRAGNLILVKATADSTVGNFILDTGAPHLVLNITYFRHYPATEVQEAEQTGITGSTPRLSRTQVAGFDLGGLSYTRLEADLANLGHIENSKGIKILGLIGLDLLRNCEMVIDYEENLIYLHRIAKKDRSPFKNVKLQDTASYKVIPFDLMDNRIIVNTVMAGRKLKFVVDCAAETNVLDSRLPDKILDLVTITRRVVLTGSGNRKVDALYGDLQRIKIGNEEIGNMPVLITNLENTCFSYAGCVDGVLGFDFLSLHKVGFNFVKRKMYIWK